MLNLVALPFKTTYTAPISKAVREYISTHPDAFAWDISRWETLRADALPAVHVNRIDALIKYHAQLVFILTKLPPDIGLEFHYAPAFSPKALPAGLANLHYERAAVLFNLAALYSQLASAEDRATADGLKRATVYYQNAAGTLAHLRTSVLPKLLASLHTGQTVPLDLSEAAVTALEHLMLAQAQECAWQRAVMDGLKNALIAKLASKASLLYASSLATIRGASRIFPSDWLAHIEAKQLHFDAVAQYRKSVDELEANRYGDELARLALAETSAKRAYDVARRGGAAPAVVSDAQSLLAMLTTHRTRAQRDNDLIYHSPVPPAAALAPVPPAALAQSTVPRGVADPDGALDGAGLFETLVPWGAREAINIYEDRRTNWIKDEVEDAVHEQEDEASTTLQALNLPAALEALEKPIGLPPSLLRKAEEVRTDDGPHRIDTLVRDVRTLARRGAQVLDEAMDILDLEASEDETFRAAASGSASPRAPSHVANRELVDMEARYRAVLAQAAESDQTVREKWDEWDDAVAQLTWDEADLEAAVPTTTASLSGSSPTNPETTRHARALRRFLESLDDISRSRDDALARARRLAAGDDVRPRIVRAAGALARWAEVQPAMFEDVMGEEMEKYAPFARMVKDAADKQADVLERIKTHNVAFLQSRRDDPAVKEREHALQSLDLAYHKYKEITRNLEEGLQFYNGLATIFAQFKDACNDWARERRLEIDSLTLSMQSLSLDKERPAPVQTSVSSRPRPAVAPQPSSPAPPVRAPAVPAPSLPAGQIAEATAATPVKPGRAKAALDLPPPDSDQWEPMVLPPAPASPPAPAPATGRKKIAARLT